jgi:hypothetical protein
MSFVTLKSIFEALETIFLTRFGRKIARDGDPKSLEMMTHDWGWPDLSSPSHWGGLRPPPVTGLIFFFFLVRRKSRRR